MRIGIDATPITNRSGTGYYTQKLIEYLSRVDSENEYLIFVPKGYQKSLDRPGVFDYPNYQLININARGQLSQILWKQLWLPQQIRKHKIDLFHFPSFIASLRTDVPSVLTIHDLCFELFPDAFSRFRRHYYQYIIPRSIKHSDTIIADSDSTRNDILERMEINRRDIHTVHLGVDPARFYHIRDKAKRSRLREQYGLPDEFILYVGTLEPRKNIPRLIKAFNYGIASKGLKADLVIAGRKGWLFDEIFREVKSLNLSGRVHFPGFIPPTDLATLYSMARAMAYPSMYEGFGLPCLEAMSCGTPVITSDRSSLPELVGNCAIKIDPTSTESIANALREICLNDQLHEEISELGSRRASHFSWQTTAKKTAELYNRTYKEAR